jgi:hypothetical protein
MNGKKAKALRRAAKQVASQFPIHNMRASYQDIVRQHVTEQVVIDEGVVKQSLRKLGRLLGIKTAPKTKKVEKVIHESRQTVMVAGWRFIQQRLKAAIRRREARLIGDNIVPAGRTSRSELRATLVQS